MAEKLIGILNNDAVNGVVGQVYGSVFLYVYELYSLEAKLFCPTLPILSFQKLDEQNLDYAPLDHCNVAYLLYFTKPIMYFSYIFE